MFYVYFENVSYGNIYLISKQRKTKFLTKYHDKIGTKFSPQSMVYTGRSQDFVINCIKGHDSCPMMGTSGSQAHFILLQSAQINSNQNNLFFNDMQI